MENKQFINNNYYYYYYLSNKCYWNTKILKMDLQSYIICLFYLYKEYSQH